MSGPAQSVRRTDEDAAQLRAAQVPADLIDVTDIDVRNILAAAHDGGDVASMAASILAHPASELLDRKAIKKLFLVGQLGVPSTRQDVVLVQAIASFIIEYEEASHE